MQGLNSIGEGLTTGLLYASFGAMAAPIIVYGSPLLIKSGAFSLSGGFSTGAILTRVGIEAGTQIAVNMVSDGISGISQIDIADVVLAGTGLNFVGSSIVGASVDWTPFSSLEKGRLIGVNKTFKDAGVDLGTGLVLGGTNNLMNSINSNRIVIGLFNLSVTTGSNEMKK